MKVNAEISKELYEICYLVENQIVGQEDLTMCDWWAKKQAFRHALTISSILKHVKSGKQQAVRIFNMSGLSSGNQDFSICYYLGMLGIPFEYNVLEHPNSPYLKNQVFQRKVDELKVNIIYGDLNDLRSTEIKGKVGDPDIILFTEIAEHLEHSIMLHSLRVIHELLADDGYLILTTPNLDSFQNRIKHLLGREIDYWGDGVANQEQGLFGHIVYYNLPRLRRLLHDVGLTPINLFTVNYPFVDPELKGIKRALQSAKIKLLDSIIASGELSWRLPTYMNTTKTLGEQIYLEARKAPRKAIPFEL